MRCSPVNFRELVGIQRLLVMCKRLSSGAWSPAVHLAWVWDKW